LIKGQTEVTHLLYRWYSEQTLKRNLSGNKYKKYLEHLMTALYPRRTQPRCEESVRQAIEICPDKEKAKYIEKE
jgi:hypothetical protein